MTMIYFSSFDLAKIQPGTITLSTSGESSIAVDLTAFTPGTGYSLSSATSCVNHMVHGQMNGFDLYQSKGRSGKLAGATFLGALQTSLRALANLATWTNPNSIIVSFNVSTFRIAFEYANAFTAITFATTECRRLFGFSGNFSGSSTTVTGTQLPKYVLVPTINGASSATPVLEDAPLSSTAYSSGGRMFSMSRSSNRQFRRWVQQYETKARTYRRFAGAAPDEFTFQALFENCRTGLPFGVYEGFGITNQFTSYMLRPGSESFHAEPATPGNASQFHIPFDTVAIGVS